MKKNNKILIKFINYLTTFLVFLGILIISYPMVSRMYYYNVSQKNIDEFKEGVKKITSEEILQRMSLAKSYNDSLSNINVEDPYMRKKHEEGKNEYARMLEVQEKIGYIQIPSLDLSLPIYAGTSESVLQKGVGHMEGTSLPIGGESTHCILTAHTGLNTARMFTDIDKLKKGDIFLIENIKETLAYKVDSIQVIEPTDFSQLVIVPKEDYVTLLTCTPYMVNSHRLLVRGVRTEYIKKSVDEQSNKNKPFLTENNLIMIATIFFDILILIIYWLILKKSRKEKSKIDKV
ncbi:class C sortase [Parvimonas micra]|uniref:Sortase family protein n=1 Tax=Parvimonas micra ATCC 33270 TaxID=411465 RepID=A8SMM7_9FIRM|nr:class C sortase [Parvimonas micra]EDP23572.1 sortase family protein [Parvimonas micra ATCC 33270]RSB90971.1 class C sortase [Parvimonas micra]VEH98306.1 Sortase (surface protein transpeptidase) [Parvimonas micra]